MVTYHNYPTSEEKKRHAEDLIRAARSSMMSKEQFLFYSQIAFGLKIELSNIGTMGTDGEKLYIDPQFVCGADPEFLDQKEELTKVLHQNGVISDEDYDKHLESLKVFYKKKTQEELVFVLLHEIRHVTQSTISRGKFLDKDLVQLASDYQINNKLCVELHNSVGQAKKQLPILNACLTDDKYFKTVQDSLVEWTMEEIYLDLLKEKDKQTGKGKGSSFDVHFEISEEQAEIIKSSVITAARLAGNKGTPQDITNLVDSWTKPKIKWHRLLDRTLKSFNIKDLNYQQPNARSWPLTSNLRASGVIDGRQYYVQPSYTKEETINILLAFDMSGSINNDIKIKILSEVAGILKQFQSPNLHILCWDTEVHNYQTFTSTALSDIKNYKLKGGGGTEVNCIFNYMKDNSINVDQVVVFTDGYFFSEPKLKAVKNPLWVIFDNKAFKVSKGKVVHYED